ncbi:ketoacyl-ACP synthase III [Puteibacter caeruleilacunae]|nr:ketoacyl-ACP synthase III [Puteibacter caeruleilacunae]
MKAKLTGIGSYVPETILDNKYFEEIIETSDEWIKRRTGIAERRKVADDQTTSNISAQAALNLAEENNIDLKEVDFVIVATSSYDHVIPNVASQVCYELGLKNVGAIDVTAACAGFGYGIQVAQGLVMAGNYKKILVIGAETLTRFTDYTDRTTCILFGDGAGASIVEAAEESNILASVSGTDSHLASNLYLANICNNLNGQDIDPNGYIHQDGKKVFKWAVDTVSTQFKKLVEKAGLEVSDIDWFVPHSANMRIVEAVCRNVGFPVEQTLACLENFGNTSAASVPLALHNGVRNGKVRKGDKLLLIGFGGGLTFAGSVVEW